MGEAEGQFRMRLMIASNDSTRFVCESIESSGLINIVMQDTVVYGILECLITFIIFSTLGFITLA